MREVVVAIKQEDDVLVAAQTLREAARRFGMPPRQEGCLDLVVRELAWNLVHHAGGGTLRLAGLEETHRRGVCIESNDGGSGITSLRRKTGLGAGLGVVMRQCSEFSLATGADGTRVQAVMWWACRSS
ncbi:MAG: ATP-binding protein [Candidatus Xenobia bacterium]